MIKKRTPSLPSFLIILIFFSTIALLYIKNLTRDVFGADVGDLVTASFVGGVAHPPGYPFFTLLGLIMSHAPLPIPPVSKIGLISVIASLLSLFFYFKWAQRMSKNIVISTLSTSILALSYLFWFYAELPEVFALNGFFAVLLLYLSLLFHETKKVRYFYLLTFFSALSLTHHPTILFVFPGIFILVIKHIKIIFNERKRLIMVPLLILAGLLPFLYIPIAASRSPVINWDNAVNVQNFIHLILRKDYSWHPGPGVDAPIINGLLLLKFYFISLKSSLTIPALLIACIGMVWAARTNTRVFFALILGYLLSGPFAIFYASSVIRYTFGLGILERFFLLSTVILVFFLPYGFLFIKKVTNKILPKKTYSYFVILVFLVIPLSLYIINSKKTDFSNSQLGNNYALDIISQVPKNSIILTFGDVPTFSLWYVHYVLGIRPDVTLTPRDPGNGGPSPFWDKDMNDFAKRNPKIKDHEKLMASFLEYTTKKRHVFAIEPIFGESPKFLWVRKGLIYELIPFSDIPPEEKYVQEIENIWKKYHVPTYKSLIPSERNFISEEISRVYSYSLSYTGNFIDAIYQDLKTAAIYYNRALEIDPENPEAYGQLGFIEFWVHKDCKNAAEYERKAINTSFTKLIPSTNYYIHLYHIYDKCGNKTMRRSLEREFRTHFNKDLKKIAETNIILRY